MAEYASASPSGVKLHTWRSFVNEKALFYPNSHFPIPPKRKFSQERYKVLKFSPGRTCTTALPHLKEIPYHVRETASRCSCLGSLVDSDGITASELVAVSDQLLLMASIVLTYMAGVIPIKRPTFSSLGNIVDNNVVRESSTTSSGSAKKNAARVNSKCAWDAVKEKLLDSLGTIENRNNLGNRLLEIEQQQGKRPLSLYAISEGPKLRLLWASFTQLENEVNGVLDNCKALSLDDWLITVPDIIRKSCNRACIAWLLEELHLENKKADEGIISLMIQKLKGDETVLQNIRKSGKENIYAELLYFLKFGSLRTGCYEQSLFSSNGDSILEDMVITLADGVAGVCLELISVDGNLSNDLNDLGMIICNLSTRALQRLRNEVCLNQWLYQNMEAVASMYEDQFDLCTLQSKIKEEPSQMQTEENFNWWKKLTQRKSGMLSPSSSYVVISHFSMPVKRTKELRALTGWRYYFSLYLEVSDITTPLIRAVIDKISSAISFFLVSLIGRSLGLIYTGIRQSLRWK